MLENKLSSSLVIEILSYLMMLAFLCVVMARPNESSFEINYPHMNGSL